MQSQTWYETIYSFFFSQILRTFNNLTSYVPIIMKLLALEVTENAESGSNCFSLCANYD